MAFRDVADQYFTYDARLASFQNAQQVSKRRASNANTKAGKPMKWPHEFLSGDELAKAGFFYCPQTGNPDNVACFLCHCYLDGWEEDDDPLAEHLKHAPDCGWAIVTIIEKQDGAMTLENPWSSAMIAARKATFADKWPHEGKRGWKCKVKQMVDAGWKYTPTSEDDDMATCAYCNLALDGWENSDKPMDEHFKRSPECPFFTLVDEHMKSPASKKVKSKRGRPSKASRISTQSAFTVASEAPEDLPAEEEDSILTTATNATTKKMGKAKKASATRGRKTRAKRSEPVEVMDTPEPEDVGFDLELAVEGAAPKRGRKRKSQEETAPSFNVAPPPAKRRAARMRGSNAVDDSIISHDDQPQEQHKAAGRKGRPSRKVSSASAVRAKAPVLDDDEIDKALEADLDRPLTEDEGEPAAFVPPKRGRASKIVKAGQHMFDAAPVEIDEADIDAELEAIAVDSKPPPKAKGAKGKQPRKVSAKQRAAEKKVADAASEAGFQAEREQLEEEGSPQIDDELEHSVSLQHSSPIVQQKKQRALPHQAAKKAPGRATRGSVMSASDHSASVMTKIPEENDDSGSGTDASMASQSTVVRGGSKKRGSTMKKGKGGKKGGSKNIEDIVHEAQEPDVAIEDDATVPSVKNKRIVHVEEITVTEETYYSPVPEIPEAEPVLEEEASAPLLSKSKAANPRGRPRKLSTPAPPSEQVSPDEEFLDNEASNQREVKAVSPFRSPTPVPMEMTPSQSPQSSDAENHPPSKPSAVAQKVATPASSRARIPLSETTPIMSPSKRHVIAGLQSNQPWSSVDLDTIFMKSPRATGPDGDPFGGAAEKVKNGELTSPEKKMTVEEWIQHNATMAEEKLRSECERMVSVFESEGSRAMQALEGVDCLE